MIQIYSHTFVLVELTLLLTTDINAIDTPLPNQNRNCSLASCLLLLLHDAGIIAPKTTVLLIITSNYIIVQRDA